MYRRRWRYVQYLADQFWRKWTKEYLAELQRRNKWTMKSRNLHIGDLVLVVEENTPRGLWPLGIITDVNLGRDNLVRTVKIRTRSTQMVRPITKVVILEGSQSQYFFFLNLVNPRRWSVTCSPGKQVYMSTWHVTCQ